MSIFPSKSRSPKLSLPFRFSDHNLLCISSLQCVVEARSVRLCLVTLMSLIDFLCPLIPSLLHPIIFIGALFLDTVDLYRQKVRLNVRQLPFNDTIVVTVICNICVTTEG
jgi:hypothetical protein